MTNKCEICKNKEICKYREEYEARFEKLSEMDEIKIFPLTLDCKFYENAGSIDFTEPYIDYQTQSDKTSISTRTACQDCDFYHNYRLKGQTYWTGDIPCQWCSNSPTRVTCAAYDNKSTVTKGVIK